jgi:methylenetetrahydrofolate dehydrogenase (NADP+) / methenyltetrahydrofolate cyclohydrolase
MAQILEGRPVAAAMDETTKGEVQRLAFKGVHPCLAILRVGENEGDLSYEKSAAKRCEALGIKVLKVSLPADVRQEELFFEIEKINAAEEIHGCLILRPLPFHIDDRAVRALLKPSKDVDGITEGSLACVFSDGGEGFAPCTAEACIRVLEHYNIKPRGLHAVVVGRSLVIGKPVAMMLLGKNATVTICHTKTQNMAGLCKAADILVVSAGKQGIVNQDFFHENQVILDVGIHVDDSGKITGDIDFTAAQAMGCAVTPVPGGVGAVTTAVLADHVVKAAASFDRLCGQ